MRTRFVYLPFILLGLFVAAPLAAQTGTIVGKVTVSGTKSILESAAVTIKDTKIGAFSGKTGRFKIPNVTPGTHTLIAKRLGYKNLEKTVTVRAGQETRINFEMEEQALTLDEVVATGSTVETTLKQIPSAITVITADQIAEKSVRNFDDLLRGAVPGLTVFTQHQYNYFNSILIRGQSSIGGSSVMIFVDGVQVANSYYIQQIDVNSIERIEILRGPQAATIYGSGAENGVIQIFTKKGSDTGIQRPRVNLTSSYGYIQTNWSREGEVPTTTDQNIQVTGGTSSMSYSVGFSWDRVEGWMPDLYNRTQGLSAGIRTVHGPFSAEATVRYTNTMQSIGIEPLYEELGINLYDRYELAYRPGTRGMSLKMTYAPVDWWQNEVILGRDISSFNIYSRFDYYPIYYGAGYYSYQNQNASDNVRYNTTLTQSIGQDITFDVQSGFDWRHYKYFYNYAFGTRDPLQSTQCLNPPPGNTWNYCQIYKNSYQNSGFFSQVKVGWRDQVFLWGGYRLQTDETIEQWQDGGAPRLGASYTTVFDLPVVGEVETKFRAQWGQSIKSPTQFQRFGSNTSQYYIYLPNPGLQPERAQGFDGGFDLYFGNTGTLSVTAYQQRTKNLIYLNYIDLVNIPRIYQYINIGTILNTGWELEGTLTYGPIQATANFAITNSSLEEFNADYADLYYWLQIGEQFNYTPKQSGGMALTYNVGRGRVTLHGNFLKDFRALKWVDLWNLWYGEGGIYKNLDEYYAWFPTRWSFSLRSEQAVTDNLSAFFNVDNLGNSKYQHFYDDWATQPRSLILGLRFSY